MRKHVLLLMVLCGLTMLNCYARKPHKVKNDNPPCYVENEDENYYYAWGKAEGRDQRQSQLMAIRNAQNELMRRLGANINSQCEMICTQFGYTEDRTIITYVSIRVLKSAIIDDIEHKTDTLVIR